MTNDQEDALKDLEKNIYILKQDVQVQDALKQNAGGGNEALSIRKGEKVKLIVFSTANYIKIYCYRADEPLLNAGRALLVYLFQEDFKDEKFNMDLIQEKLQEKVEIIKNN